MSHIPTTNKFHIRAWALMPLLVLGLSGYTFAQTPTSPVQADSVQIDSTLVAQPRTPTSPRYAPPPPTLRFFIEDEIIDLGGSVTTTQLPLLQLRVVPDSTFAAEHPYDVKYAVVWTAFVKRGMNLGPPQKGNTHQLYGPVTSTANKGDIIQVEVDRIVRTDSVGRTEKIVLDKTLKYLTLPVK